MKPNKKIVLEIVGILCLVAILVALGIAFGKSLKDEPATEAGSETGSELAKDIQLPYELEDGKLQVHSLFQSSISNPDGDGAYVEDLASLEITNNSKKHLQEATIKVVLENGKELNFLLEEIPAGKKVWVFDVNNQSIEMNEVISQITCDGKFTEKTEVMEDKLKVEAKDTLVSVTNKGDNDLEKLELEFHCLFDDVYYGGKTYKYQIDILKEGENTSIDVWECYLGKAEVVKIER